ncbi:MAG: TonB family protein [Acidobacteriota bacterium]|jgi:TonB family protein
MAENLTTFGSYLLLKRRATDALGELWRAGEMERAGFKRIAWLRLFNHRGLDRSALESDVGVANQVAAHLKGSNVARSAAFGVEDGVPYMAWDFVPGQPLDQLLARVASEQFPVAIDNALLITEKISAALAAGLTVERGGEPLIHGFLIPSMVMVGNDGEAAVAGFGLMRGLLANLDRVEVQALAAPYLAPEVLNTSSASRRSDVYSLGAILYHLLCGHALPADPAQRAEALKAPQLALDEGPVPEDVLAILRKALAARPDERFSSAVDFKRDLEKLLYGGAYSPTSFNLALFMDRLYRQDIEEEDRELQREKTLDVTPYYKPPKGVSDVPAAVAEMAKPSRVPLLVAAGAVVVLGAVVLFLLFGRPAPQPIDEAAQKQMFSELVGVEVARQLAEREAKLRQELELEKEKTAEVRAQLEKLQRAASQGTQRLSSEEQTRLEEAKRLLAAREAEERRREEELAKLQQQRAEAQAAAVRPTPQPTAVIERVPTPVPVQPTAVAAVVEPTAVPVVPAPTVATPAEPPGAPVPAVPGIGLGGAGVREGDFVDYTQVDSPPVILVKEDVILPRSVQRLGAATGTVILQALVNHQGAVEKVEVLRGFPVPRSGVDEACIEAVKKYRFKPGMKHGVRIRTHATVTLHIDLSKAKVAR